MSHKPIKIEGFDRVFKLVGGGGIYQWLLFLVCSLQGIFICFHHIGYVFLGAVPEHWCEVDDLQNTNWTQSEIKNLSIPRKTDENSKWESCSYYDLDYKFLTKETSFEDAYSKVNYSNTSLKSCTKWNYDNSIFGSTVVSQFDLVCDRRYLVATIQASYMAGVFAGSLIMGALSDNVLGRRNSVIISVCIVMIFGFAAGFANSYSTFVTARFFIAVGATGSFQNTFSLLTEFCDTENRAIIALFSNIPFAIGYMVMPVLAYYIQDWVKLQFTFSVSTLTLISYFWLLPNSPRWLAVKGRHEEALIILNQIAKTNRKPMPHRLEMLVILESCKSDRVTEDVDDSTMTVVSKSLKNIGIGYANLVRTPTLRRRSFLIWFLFITVTLVYYGLLFDSALLTTDPFFLVFVGGLMELPAYIIVVPFVTKWGRTPTVASCFFITGVSCVIVACTPRDYNFVRVFFAMVGKLFISGCFAVIYLLPAELYPTSERATGLGCAVLTGRIGSISAPYVVDLTRTIYADLPSIVFGAAGIISSIVTLFLPETKDLELSDNIQNLERKAMSEEGSTQIAKIVRRLSHPHVELQHLPQHNSSCQ